MEGETYIITFSQTVVISPAQEGGVEHGHVVTAVVVLVGVVEAGGGAGDAGELADQGELEPLLHLSGLAAGTGGGADRDGGDGVLPGHGPAPVLPVTDRSLVRAVLVIGAS